MAQPTRTYYGVPMRVNSEYAPPGRVQRRVRWPLSLFWGMRDKGNAGAVQPSGSLPGTVAMLPHRVAQYRRPAFWSPAMHFLRQEVMVKPPMLPGTAIPSTLFHPVYSRGQQGWMDTTPWNYWISAWGLINFEKWNTLGLLADRPVTGRGTKINVFAPQMIGRPFWDGKVWQQPRPYYIPTIINPGTR